MKKIPVALQLYSVREDAQRDFAGTMKRVKEIGYDCVELAGLHGMEPARFRSLLDEAGLKAISAHVPYAELTGDVEQTVSDYAAIGCEYIAIPYLTEELRPRGRVGVPPRVREDDAARAMEQIRGITGFEQVLAAIPVIGRVCGRHGITLLYHNHDFEFEKLEDGRYALDYMYETIGADLLQTELDTCWVNVAGENPVEYIRKYTGRCPVIHLKDFYLEGTPENLYELIGIESDETTAAEKGRFEFRPVGYGMQVMPEILEAGAACGAKYFVVEQDLSVGRPALDAVKMSRDYLRPLGY